MRLHFKVEMVLVEEVEVVGEAWLHKRPWHGFRKITPVTY